MRVILEPEDGDEFERVEFSGVFECALCGRRSEKGLFEVPFSHVHRYLPDDKYTLLGRLSELVERLRGSSSD